MKKCSKCRIFKGLSCFNKNKARYDGHANYCKKCESVSRKQHYEKYKDRYREKHRKYQQDENNKHVFRKANRKFARNNRGKINDYKNKRYHNDNEYRILAILRSRLVKSLNGKSKDSSAKELLGCDIKDFISHIESQFTENMNWENYGTYWHIDHIIPCAKFDLSNLEEQKVCFHHTNMQPLEAKKNIAKSDFMLNGERGRWNKT